MFARPYSGKIPWIPSQRGWLFLLCLFLISHLLTAQDTHLILIEKRASADAAYEQEIQWQTEEDELDYWTDQRKFEKALRQEYFQGYRVYILTKKAIYREHRASCDTHCGHGDYYQLQAAYYYQLAEPAPPGEEVLATNNIH